MPSLEATRANLRESIKRFDAREDFRLNLFERATGGFVGGSGLHRPDWSVPTLEIGYWVRASLAGQGFITEAVVGITQFAFEDFHARRVEIRMSSCNTRSERVAQRAGFELEATLRSNERNASGTLRDTRVYSLIRPDPQSCLAL